MFSYYENANAPSSGTSVTVNTQTSIPGSSGSFMIPSGTSAYLWTPQFTTGKTIPSGKMPIDLWASTTPTLDGVTSAGFNSFSGTVYLTTTEPDDLIYVVVSVNTAPPTVSISGSGLTWYLRGSVANGGSGKVMTFYATSPNVLSSSAITANVSPSNKFTLIAFGISGANTASPFDPNLTNVVTKTGSSSTPSWTVTTSSTNTFLIGALYVHDIPTVTQGTGFSLIDSEYSSTNVRGAAEYDNAVASGINTVSFSLSASKSWALICDAIVPSTSTLSVSAYTTNYLGYNYNTIFSNLITNPVSTSGQVATSFSVSASTIPNFGYVKIVLTAPSDSDIIINWGNGKPTNIQIALTYSG